MPLPIEVHAAIRKAFRSAGERKKATLDAETMSMAFGPSPELWDESSFRKMARQKGWADTTLRHRWGIFERMLLALHSPGQALTSGEESDHEAPTTIPPEKGRTVPVSGAPFLSEDDVKRVVQGYLTRDGWNCTIKWGQEHGIDIVATRGDRRWLIEAKGQGSRSEMRVNYFLGVLGETLQRMTEPECKYSIALPDIPQFRSLWNRLPTIAKARTGITALFVSTNGSVSEVS